MRGRSRAWLAILAAAACNSAALPDGDAVDSDPSSVPVDAAHTSIVVDSPAYTLRPDAQGMLVTEIGFSFRNTFPDTVYVVNCRGELDVRIERLDDDGEWVHYWIPQRFMCLSSPITIAPGRSYRGSVPIFGWRRGRNIGPELHPLPDPASVYRLSWGNHVFHYNDSGRPFGDPLPGGRIVSNPFGLSIDSTDH